MTTSPPTIGGDTDAIRRYAEEIRAHGEDVYLSVRKHTRNVRNAFIAEASANTRSGGVAPVYEEMKTALFAVMDRLDDAAAVIRQEQEDTARELEVAAAEFDQHDSDAASRLSQIGTVDLTSGPPQMMPKPATYTGPVGGAPPVENKPGALDDFASGPPVEKKPGEFDGQFGGPAPTDTRPFYLSGPDDVADTLGGAIGDTPDGGAMIAAGLPGGVPLHAKTDVTPLPHVDSIVAGAIDHDQHTIHVTDLPGGVPGPHITDTRPSAASTPPDYRFDV